MALGSLAVTVEGHERASHHIRFDSNLHEPTENCMRR
jgi:hypothetical protein